MRLLIAMLFLSLTTYAHADFYTGHSAKEIVTKGKILHSDLEDGLTSETDHIYHLLMTYKGQIYDCYVQSDNNGRLMSACKDDLPLTELDSRKALPNLDN